MKYGSDEINCIGFVKDVDGQITIFMASKRKDDEENIVMYYIPTRCYEKKKYLDEICEEAIGWKYDHIIEAIKEYEGDANVIRKSKAFQHFKNVSFKC